jgi:hypothetical protein
MGLDGWVACNCLAKGLARPATVPVHIGPDGDLAPVDEADRLPFTWWQKSSCDHPDRELACVPIGNWTMVRAFLRALELVGQAHFPTLLRVLPEESDGHVAPVDARACLAELAEFRRLYRRERPVLFACDGGEALLEVHLPEGHILATLADDGLELGVDEDGLFVVPQGTRAAIFSARRVELRGDAGGGTELVDLDSGASLVTRRPVPGDALLGHRRVELRPMLRTAADHAPVIDALEHIFRVSIETGNPVLWC